MLRRAFPVFLTLFVGLLPVMPEALAFAHGTQEYVPMSRADRMSRGACAPPSVPFAAIPSNLPADAPPATDPVPLPVDAEDEASCPDGTFIAASTLSPANRIRAPNHA